MRFWRSHFLLHCPVYNNERSSFLSTIRNNDCKLLENTDSSLTQTLLYGNSPSLDINTNSPTLNATINSYRPNSRQSEKFKLNFYFHTSLCSLKRFYEGLKDLHKTFWGTAKKCEIKNLTQFLFQCSFQKWRGLQGLTSFCPLKCLKKPLFKKIINFFFCFIFQETFNKLFVLLVPFT